MWVKKGHIFSPPTHLKWANQYAAVPVARYISEQNLIRIIYTTRDSEKRSIPSYIDVDANNPGKILYIHDQPLIGLGKLGAFDDCGVMPSWLFQMDNQLYLYYVGWNVRSTIPYHNSIGLLISDDNGRSFRRISDGPIIDRNMIDPYFTASVCIYKTGDLLQMAYLSCTEFRMNDGKVEPRYLLKYAESADGIYWKRSNEILINYHSDNEAGIARPSVIFRDNKYLMWYSCRYFGDFRNDPEYSYRIGFAVSGDFKNWIRNDELAGIDCSDSGWDSEMIEYPHVIEAPGKLLMFYNGNCFGKSGFGYAEWSDE
jgi:hypothetical protein